MREFIASEKMRLQVLFDEFNRDESIMVMREGHDTPLPLGLAAAGQSREFRLG